MLIVVAILLLLVIAVIFTRAPLDVAMELGPVGLRTGWRGRIARVTRIVFAQLLVYDAVKDVLASPR